MARRETIYIIAFTAALALLPLIAIDMPRFYAFGPGLIGLLFMLLFIPVFKERPGINKYVWLPPITLLALAALSVLWSITPDTSLERVYKLCTIMIPGGLFLTLIQNLKIEKLQPYLWLVPAAVIGAALLSTFELLSGGVIHNLLRGLPLNTEVNASVFNRGAVATTLCAFPAYSILRSYLTVRPALIAIGVPIVCMMFVTQSQSAQLALLMGLLIFFLFPCRRKKAWMGLIGAIILAILTAPFLGIWMFDSLASTLDTAPFFGVQNGYAGARLEIWHFIGEHILKSPLFGYGIEATRVIDDFETDRMYFTDNSVLHPHNFALQFWMEFGVFGAAIASALCRKILWMMRNLTPEQCKATLPTFMATMSVAATGYGFWQSWWLGLLFMVSGLCLLSVQIKSRTA